MARGDEHQSRLADAQGRRDRDQHVAELLAADVPVAPVLDRDGMLRVPHFAERDVVTVDDAGQPATGHPVRFATHPATRTSPAPALDEHRGAGFLPR
jgi:crotonobetainyl-CoA:carnitine CoA-transferase CaiB-like acyl-CoA transferase